MSKRVAVKGLNKFIRLVAKNQRTIDSAVSKEINRSSLRVEKRAKMIAPWETGWLSNGIYSQMISLLLAEIVSPTEYSVYQEEGTRYMTAQPFLRPALEAEYPVIMKNLNKLMRG